LIAAGAVSEILYCEELFPAPPHRRPAAEIRALAEELRGAP
jgi:hypothetical protein